MNMLRHKLHLKDGPLHFALLVVTTRVSTPESSAYVKASNDATDHLPLLPAAHYINARRISRMKVAT